MPIRKEEIVYLDSNATTQVDPMVVETMLPFLSEFYGNPSSPYAFGKQVDEAIEKARGQVAQLIGCAADEVVFTSCGTESNNAAVQSALQIDPDRQHVVTTRVEHSAVLKHCETLAKRGVEVTWLGVDERGQIDLAELEKAIRPDTAIVSVMWANNETGVLFPIEEIAQIVQRKKTLLHTDAVQAVGKIPIDVSKTPIHFLSLSGHKLHCPKGIGVLYVNKRTPFRPYLIGGGQEGGRRAGTQNVASIVALGKGCELAAQHMAAENNGVRALRNRFEQEVLRLVPGTQVNGDLEQRLPNTSSLAFEGLDAEALLLLLSNANICCSAGSACTSGSLHPSHVLKAMGFSNDRARSSLRFSFSRFNTEAEVDKVLELLPQIVAKVRRAIVS